MTYVLRIAALGRFPEIDIDIDRYNTIKQSKSILNHSLAIEEKYEILIQNYLEFEKGLLNVTASDMIKLPVGYNEFFDVRLIFNRLIVNLLTAARLYIDQLHRHVRACLPEDRDILTKTKAVLSEQYDSHPEYRFMEALRNHVQHYGLAVHKSSSGGKRTSLDEDGFLEYAVNIASQKTLLSENSDFKKQVLDEIHDTVDLKLATRGYIASLSNVHEAIRTIIQASVSKARHELELAISDYKKVLKDKVIGLSAMHFDGKRNLQEKVHILLDWDDVRVRLCDRNKALPKLSKCYVTSKAES